MANPTVTLVSSLTWVDSLGNVQQLSGSKSFTQAGTTAGPGMQIIGTTTEQLVIPSDSVPPGILQVKNIDPTNYVELDLNTPVAGTAFAKLLAGDVMQLPTAQTTIYAKANTAACILQFLVTPR